MSGDEIATVDAREEYRPGIPTSNGLQISECFGSVLCPFDVRAKGCVPDVRADVGGL